MDFGSSEEDEAFRREVADFFDRELTLEIREEYEERGLPGPLGFQFMKKLGAKGWLGLSWPKEYGGRARHVHKFILGEEMARRGVEFRNLAESLFAPTLILYGSEKQKREYLPKIRLGEMVCCALYSEPNAGSDLASLELRAEPEGNGYVLQGQKVWASEADLADHGFLLARTNRHVPKHRGISIFLIEMQSPGLTVRPLISMAGDRRFNEVFFDRVCVDNSCLVGEPDKGWYYLGAALDFERYMAGAFFYGNSISLLNEIVGYATASGTIHHALVRKRIAERFIDMEVLRLLCYRVLWLAENGKVPNYEASMVKLFGSELTQQIAQTGMEILGLYGQLGRGSPRAPYQGRINLFFLRSISDSIRAGTSEIQRNTIALRGLGLPAR